VSSLAWLTEPWSSELMRRAFVEGALCGATCGALGCFVTVRRLAFLGESIAHTVVLGAVLALLVGLPVGLGAVALAITTALLTGAIAADRRFSADTATGVLLPVLFGTGVALASLGPGRGPLEELLFGSILSVTGADVLVALALVLGVAAVLWLVGKELVLVAFDRASARALGYPVARLDALLLVLVAVAIAIGLRAVGGVLLAGLLFGPPVAARLVCRRFWTMTALAAALGTGCALSGLYLTWHLDIAAGPAIVLAVAAACAVVALARGAGRTAAAVAPEDPARRVR
jgi:manganese/iron transport system permease protein